VDGHDAVVDLAEAAEVLPLHPRRLVPLLEATGLVDHAHAAERVGRQGLDHRCQVPLQRVAGAFVVPVGGGEELLQGTHGRAAGQGDRFDALAGQVGEQSAAVVVEVPSRPVLEEARAERPQKRSERGAELSEVLIGHEVFPPGDPIIQPRKPAL
jgi:hypothetical protein